MENIEPAKQKILDRIENDFVYHAPFGDQVERYAAIRAKLLDTARFIVLNTPCSREQSQALSALELAMFEANAAIARNEKPSSVEAAPDAYDQANKEFTGKPETGVQST